MKKLTLLAMALPSLGICVSSSAMALGDDELKSALNELKIANQKLLARVEQLEAERRTPVPPKESEKPSSPTASNVVTSGDLPNSIRIPGTNTSLRVYGYAQTDSTYSFRGRFSDQDNYDWASWVAAQPLDKTTDGRRRNQFYLTARTSRFGLESATPSSLGQIATKIEGDFNAPNPYSGESLTNSMEFRLRHAYGVIGDRLLVGQTWSNFSDTDSFPNTVDFNIIGPASMVRQPQVRYTQPLVPGSAVSVSVENPQSRTSGYAYDKTPDLTAKFVTKGDWGHFAVRSVFQQFRNDQHSRGSFGLGLGGSIKLGDDRVVAQINGGNGIGRYMLNSLSQGAYDNGSQISLWRAVGGYVGYTRSWSPIMRSSLNLATTRFSGSSDLENLTDVNKAIHEVLVNTFWNIDKNASFGIEYAYGQRITFANDRGTNNRINAMFRYALF